MLRLWVFEICFLTFGQVGLVVHLNLPSEMPNCHTSIHELLFATFLAYSN
jgi:hypothetical protein